MTKRRKMLVVVLILAILLQFVAPLCQVVNAATGTEITLNQKLYKAVKASLIASKQASFSYSDSSCTIIITDTELAKVTELDLSESEISDLTGLSAFTSVTNLDLSGNDLTADSNLGEIDSLALASSNVDGVLDLSSNKLESISTITSFRNIAHTDIENQEVTSSLIIEVDDSGEDEDAVHSKTYTVTLPDILLEDESSNYQLQAGWFSSTTTGNCTVSWDTTSGNTVSLVVASGSGSEYSALEGLITITVDIKEKTYPNSDLVNTHMTLYYCVIGSGKTGIMFKDSNLYNAIKEQLTAGQSINEELDSYEGLDDPVTLYEVAYDEALILVIDDDVLLNDITSLILNDIQVSDLTGIEKFIGLESSLNVSYNYIDSIDRIIELEENKEAAEAELQEKYLAKLSELSENRETLKSYEEQLTTLQKELVTLQEELAKLEAATNLDADAITNKEDDIKNKEDEIGVCRKYISTYTTYVTEDMADLYEIYHKEYLLTTILTTDTISLTSDDLSEASENQLKSWASIIISNITTLEKTDSLTTWESNLMIEEYNIPTTTEVIRNEGTDDEYLDYVAIENPISEYFSDPDKVIDDYYSFVYEMKVLDSIITAANYCVYLQTFEGADECQFSETAFEQYIADLDTCGLDTTFAYLGLSYVDSYTDTCMCEETEISWVTLAGKLVNSSDLVTTLIKIPRLKYLDMTNNSLTSINGIETLTELETLLLFQNFLGTGNISEVDWSTMTKLTTLDLGYNQLTFDDINCLTALENLEYLYLTKNLLEGEFSFDLTAFPYLEVADFSYNQISDISNYINAYQFKALGAGMSISEYLLSDLSPDVYFQFQTLSGAVTVSQSDNGYVTVDLPYIYRQAESIDYTRTNFGVQSLYGSVDSTGETATFYVPSLGTYSGYVTIDGNNGGVYDSNGEYYAYSTEGIAYGTTYTLEITVVEAGDDTVDVVVDGSTLDSSTLECVVSGSGTFLYTLTGADLENRNLTFDWSISGASSEDTTIVDEGENLDSDNSKMTEYAVLTIGDDETADYITITVTTSEGATTTLRVKIEYTTDDGTGDSGNTGDTGSTGDSGSTEDGDTTDVVTYTAEGDDGEEITVSAGSSQDLTFTYTSSAVDSTWVADWTVSGASSESTTIVDYGESITTGEQLTESATLKIGEDEDADTITVIVTLSNGDTRSVVFTKVGTTTDTDDTGSGSTESGSSSGTETGDTGSTGDTTTDPEETSISYNYTISNDLVYVKTPGMTVEEFENGLIATDGYVVEVTNSEDAYDDSILATSAIVTIKTEDGEKVTSLEVVVLGDVNGDGKVNALDSGLMRSVISGDLAITGTSYRAAADVNMDGSITKDDSVLVLQYRAKKITDFE